MSDDSLSKRERQKQRRDAKRVQERADQAKSRRKRLGFIVLAGVIVAALVGAGVARVVANRQDVERRAEAAEAKQAELGCTEIQDLTDNGAGHIQTTPEALAAATPDMLYPDRPTASGQHIGQVVRTGVYDVAIDERLTTHNLEHGYLVYWYAPDAPEEEVQALKTWAQGRIDGGFQKIVVAEWNDGELPEGANFASIAWNHRQLCEQFDEDVFQVMIDQFMGADGDAPPNEKAIPAHLSADAPGVLVPEGEPLLFPPLGEATGESDAMGDGATGAPAPTGSAPPAGTGTATEPAATEPVATEPVATEPATAAPTPTG